VPACYFSIFLFFIYLLGTPFDLWATQKVVFSISLKVIKLGLFGWMKREKTQKRGRKME
jgi:hypothetical protein